MKKYYVHIGDNKFSAVAQNARLAAIKVLENKQPEFLPALIYVSDKINSDGNDGLYFKTEYLLKIMGFLN